MQLSITYNEKAQAAEKISVACALNGMFYFLTNRRTVYRDFVKNFQVNFSFKNPLRFIPIRILTI